MERMMPWVGDRITIGWKVFRVSRVTGNKTYMVLVPWWWSLLEWAVGRRIDL